jgi:hypothetical protein
MPRARPSAGDTSPTKSRAIEVRVAELRQLFNAVDPSPFRDRDLDPRADAFIVDANQRDSCGCRERVRGLPPCSCRAHGEASQRASVR